MDKLIALYEKLLEKEKNMWLEIEQFNTTKWRIKIYLGSGNDTIEVKGEDLYYVVSKAYIKLFEWAEREENEEDFLF